MIDNLSNKEELAHACFSGKISSIGNSAALLESAAFSLINLPILREGISEDNFLTPEAEEMAVAQNQNEELLTVNQWIWSKEKLSADRFAALSPRLKLFAKNIDEYFISTADVLVRGSVNELY